MGDLTQRLLAAFVHHKIIPAEPIKDGEEFDESTPLDSIVPVNGRTDMSNLEDRIRMELKSIGLLDDDTVVRTCKSAKVQLYHPHAHLFICYRLISLNERMTKSVLRFVPFNDHYGMYLFKSSLPCGIVSLCVVLLLLCTQLICCHLCLQ